MRKISQTENIHMQSRLQKLRIEHIFSAVFSLKKIHRNPCTILPPSKPSMGIRLSRHKERFDKQNCMIHSDTSQKGSVSKKKITLIKGPARHKQISAG